MKTRILSIFLILALSTPLFSMNEDVATYEEVSNFLHENGLEKANLIIAIDFTKSNLLQGLETYIPSYKNIREEPILANLHYVADDWQNPYQQVIKSIDRVLSPFNDDKKYQVYEFGSKISKAHSVTELKLGGEWPSNTQEILQAYKELVQNVAMSRPSSFAPAIYKAIEIVEESDNDFHILLIITNGIINDKYKRVSTKALKLARSYPLSIVMVGVGDGPFNDVKELNKKAKSDNYKFVNFSKLTSLLNENHGKNISKQLYRQTMSQFAMNALIGVPEQYKNTKNLKLIAPLKRIKIAPKRTRKIKKALSARTT